MKASYDAETMIKTADELAVKNGYSKIFAKIPNSLSGKFFNAGYVKEAYVPGYYNGAEDADFVCKYFSEERSKAANIEEIKAVIGLAEKKKNDVCSKENIEYKIIICNKENSIEMSHIYKIVFKTYPFPIYDSRYIEKTMDENIVYFGAVYNGKLAALSSSEIDIQSQSVEMTDFATLPQHLGNGIALALLKKMEQEMMNRRIITAYTIARAESPGMNITFAKNKYKYCGTLVNNTNISGQIESMNVWVKKLSSR
jgi:putative beta-lysine N-acetyltransferase